MRILQKFMAVIFLTPFMLGCSNAAEEQRYEEQYLIVPLSALKQLEPDSPSLIQNTNWVDWSEAIPAVLDSPDSQAYFLRGIPDRFRRFGGDFRSPFVSPAPNPPFSAAPADSSTADRISLSEKFSKELEGLENSEMFLVAKIKGKIPTRLVLHNRNFVRKFDEDTTTQNAVFQIDWDKLYSKEKNAFAKMAFLLCERGYYENLTWNNPGSSAFSFWAQEAEKKIFAELGTDKPAKDSSQTVGVANGQRQGNSLVRSFDLLSGSRAIEQNLEIGTVFNAWKREKRTVDVDSVTGITVAEIDWKPLLENLPETKIDKLASYVPADQHIIVFPNFLTALKFSKLTEQSGIPVLQFLNYRSTSTDKRTFQRYQAQLGLSLDALTEQLGPAVIDSVAITGGDLYFPTGTDIAILFETKNADALTSLLLAKMSLKFSGDKSVKNAKGTMNGTDYISFVNHERSASAYLAKIDANTVTISNSLASLGRIVGVKTGKTESLASLDEYRFFRDRYKVGDESESVFAFLSDATIRRWCGPKWRIAASRRLWQQAILGRLQMEHITEIVNGTVSETRPVVFKNQTTSPDSQPELVAETEYLLMTNGVLNKVFGSYQFLTPIVEMNVAKISETEQNAYNRWRDEYEGRWRRNFDPIGIRITLGEKTMASDVTVMPINVRTNREFEQMFGFSTGVEFATDQSTYGMPLQWIMSININSQQFQQNANFAEQMAGGVSLGWIGSHFTLFADEDPFWGELLDVMREGTPGVMPYSFLFDEGNIKRLPLGVEVASTNPLKLAAFLTGLRTMVDQSAPDLVRWETLKHSDVSYVKIASKNEDNFGLPDDFAIYYTPSEGKLFVTLSESLMKRHIDRRLEIKTNKDATPTQLPSHQWLGQNLALRVDERAVPMLDRLYMLDIPGKMADSAWRNVSIMNEYQRRFPDQNPVAVHERLWGERLFCPNDGSYKWNETLRTFEPELDEMPQNSPIANVKEADLGVTFENEGIRARVQLNLQ